MKRSITLFVISLFICGCKSYVQVCETNSINTNVKDDFYIFENDSLKITYSFWADRGLMTFSLYNKLDIPLYIDWKKCSYIDNTVKLDYWIDEEKTESSIYYGGFLYRGPPLFPGSTVGAGAGKISSSTRKIERITFIPPISNYHRSQFYILPILFFQLDINTESREVPRNDKPRKKTKVYEKTFNKDNTPLVFRNFMTFSYTENFISEFYIDNEFYISKIQEMDKRHFVKYVYDETKKFGKFWLRDENGNPIKYCPFKKETSFYLSIPETGSIAFRK